MHFTEIYPWTWGKIENVTITGDKIAADLESKIEKYTPFDYYTSEKDNIFIKFVSICLEDIDSIKEFIQTYGFLLHDVSKSARLSEDNNGISEPYYESLKEFKQECKRCKQISDLFSSVITDELSVNNLLSIVQKLDSKLLYIYPSLLKEYIDGDANSISEKPEKLKRYVMNIIAHQINEQIKSVRNQLVVNKKTMEFEDSWKAPDLLAMIYLMFYLSITSRKVLRKCENPYCDTRFFIFKNDKRKIYCSPECARQRASFKYRELHKDEINKKRREDRAKKNNK